MRDSRWKVVDQAPKYEVSDSGAVRNLAAKSLVAVHLSKFGYPFVTLWVRCDGLLKKKTFYVHKLVANAFHPRPDGTKLVVRHLDGNPKNAHFSNLRWGTYKENEQDKKRHGRSLIGERNSQAVLNEWDVKEIRGRLSAGESKASISRSYGVHRTTIYLISARKKWKHV